MKTAQSQCPLLERGFSDEGNEAGSAPPASSREGSTSELTLVSPRPRKPPRTTTKTQKQKSAPLRSNQVQAPEGD